MALNIDTTGLFANKPPRFISNCIVTDLDPLNAGAVLPRLIEVRIPGVDGALANAQYHGLPDPLGVGDSLICVRNQSDTNVFTIIMGGANTASGEGGKTGLFSGGLIVTNVAAPNVDIAAGVGQIVDSTTDIETPISIKVSWGDFLNEAPLNILTTDETLLFVDSGGLLVKLNAANEADFRDKIFLGVLIHVPPSAVLIVNNPTVANNVGNYLTDLLFALNISIISGGIVTPVAVSLTMNITETTFFGRSINFRVDPTQPNIVTTSSEAPMAFGYSTIDGLINTGNTILDVANFNPTASTISPFGGGANTGGWWRIFKLVTGGEVILYPQFAFSDLDTILASEDVDDQASTIPTFLRDFGILIAKIACQKNATDLTDLSRVRFVYPSSIGGGGGGGGATTFTGLTDTPSAYTGATLDLVRVNVGETALEFIDPSTIGVTTWLALTDTENSFATFALDLVRVNAGETALEFIDPSLVGTTTWLALTDTESSFATFALDLVRVNAGETALEFIDPATIGGSKWTDSNNAVDIFRDSNVGIGDFSGVGNDPVFTVHLKGSVATTFGAIRDDTTITINNGIFLIKAQGNDTTGAFVDGGELRFAADGTWTTSSFATRFVIRLVQQGETSLTNFVTVKENGFMGVGDNLNLPSTRLEVDGIITTTTNTQIIAGGAITPTSSSTTVDTEAAAAADNLDDINGGADGSILYLTGLNAARVVTIRTSVGNLRLTSDFSLINTNRTLTLIKKGANWLEISRQLNVA